MLATRRTIADIGDMTPRTATAGEEHDEEPEHDQAGEQEDVRAECRGRLPSAWRRSTHDRGARAGLTAIRLPAHGGSGYGAGDGRGGLAVTCSRPSRHPPARSTFSDPCTHVQ